METLVFRLRRRGCLPISLLCVLVLLLVSTVAPGYTRSEIILLQQRSANSAEGPLSMVTLSQTAAGSSSTSQPRHVRCALPVDQQACTLDLGPGDEGTFQCAYPLPSQTFETFYNNDGQAKTLSELVPGATVRKKDFSFHVSIPFTAQTPVCIWATCSAADTTPSQQALGNPDKETAKALTRRTLLVKVKGGTWHCEPETQIKASAGSRK